jgi:hypothetical protein
MEADLFCLALTYFDAVETSQQINAPLQSKSIDKKLRQDPTFAEAKWNSCRSINPPATISIQA